MKLTIQIVNFRSRHCLRECLFSIGENLPADISAEIIIINNDEESLENVFGINGGSAVQIIEIKKNVGFGQAHNAGFRQARGEYVLFLNPDTKIPSGALSVLLDIFAGNEKVGIVAPLLVDSAGKIESDCFGSRRTPLSMIGGKIFLKKNPAVTENEIFETDWVSGGAMMARRDVFEKVGGFDENFFMYFEDVDLCRRMKKLGHRVMIHPGVRVFHESGKSFENEREKKKHYYTSQDYYLRKHFGPAWAGLVKIVRLPYYVKNVYLNR